MQSGESTESSSQKSTGIIRIIKTPVGEAPKWVRKAWIRLELPCDPYVGLPDKGKEIRGVLSNTVMPRQDGYSVPQDKALEILAEKHPKAAKWWKDHGFPRSGEYFNFNADEAKIISGVTKQTIIVVSDT